MATSTKVITPANTAFSTSFTWTPPGQDLSELSPILAPLAPVKEHVTVITNTRLQNAYPGTHDTSNAAFLSARQQNRFDGLGRRFLPTDQAKTVTVVFEYRISQELTANIRALYGSGFAYGENTPGVRDSRGHYPDYKRADARIQYARAFGDVRGMVFLEIMNLFAFRNVQSFQGSVGSSGQPDLNLLLPMVVNVGLKAWF